MSHRPASIPRQDESQFQTLAPHLRPEAIQIANDRVVYALLGLLLAQGMVKQGLRHSFDNPASTLALTARSMPDLLEKTLRADAADRRQLGRALPGARSPWGRPDRSIEGLDADGEDGFDLDDDEALSARLMLGLSHRTPSFDLFLRRMRCRVARRLEQAPAHPCDANLAVLSKTLELPAAEAAILRLAVALAAGTVPASFDFVDITTSPRALEVLLREAAPDDFDALQRMLSGRSALIDARLTSGDGHPLRRADLDDLLQLSSLGQRLLLQPCVDAVDLASRLLTPVVPVESHPPCEWPHLDDDRRIVAAVLRGALQQGARGVNVLLHGPSGTGKTLFANELIRELGVAAFQVGWIDPKQGVLPDRDERLASLKLCQRFAPTSDAVLLLDEAEDVFTHGMRPTGFSPWAHLGESSDSKAWLNQLLENNPRPVVWISNRVDHMDPAYLRRFACCIAFPVTPLTVRRSIAQQHLAAVGCSDALVERAASQPELSPGLLASAARVVALVADQGESADTTVERVLSQQLKVMGRRGLPLVRACPEFDAAYLNVRGAVHPAELMERLPGLAQANLLFSGPPGSGKTELAHQIAARLGRTLLVRTAADLHSMWFGQSEQLVAALFEDSDPQGQVLLIDEADALLTARSAGIHRADLSVLSEFLRRMETHSGLMICATNRAAALDPALMRRFVFRLEFLPLDAAQRRRLLLAQLGTSGGEPHTSLPASLATRLDRLDMLTPGDFANVARRSRAMGRPYELTQWLDELEAEVNANPGHGRRGIGFV